VPKVRDDADALRYGQRNRDHDDSHSYLTVFESPAVSPDPRRHWCVRAESEEQVRAFFEAGLAAGGTGDGDPGRRPHYHRGYFAAFLADPEGNRIEAMFHRAVRRGSGPIHGSAGGDVVMLSSSRP
jgi:catechol 2,3-dioxygenase-like lactoylglutathione lyase family enzyme